MKKKNKKNLKKDCNELLEKKIKTMENGKEYYKDIEKNEEENK